MRSAAIPKPLRFIPVDDHLQLKDATMTVDIYHVIANNHMADARVRLHPRAQGDDRRRHRHGGRGSSVVGRQLDGQHQLPEDRRAAERAGAHGRDDARAGDQDGDARHPAREGVLRAAPRQGQLLSGLSRPRSNRRDESAGDCCGRGRGGGGQPPGVGPGGRRPRGRSSKVPPRRSVAWNAYEASGTSR